MTSPRDGNQHVERVGRVAIATQGLLYGVVGVLAVQVAGGNSKADPSQRGAIHAVAVQPVGRLLLLVLAVGLASHAAWRGLLSYRGELGAEDGASIATRLANVARAAFYLSLTFVAVKVLTGTGSSGAGTGSGGGGSKQATKSTSAALGLPGGRALVIGIGLAVVAAALWNAWRGVSRSFMKALDLSSLSEGKQRGVEVLGAVGYVARAVAYTLIGWFLITAGLEKDPHQTRGLDGALRKLASTSHGPVLLFIVAVGLIGFGVYRMLDAVLRRPLKVTAA